MKELLLSITIILMYATTSISQVSGRISKIDRVRHSITVDGTNCYFGYYGNNEAQICYYNKGDLVEIFGEKISSKKLKIKNITLIKRRREVLRYNGKIYLY